MANRTFPHFCCVQGCNEKIGNDEFFCADHMMKLPPKNRKEVRALIPKGKHYLDFSGHDWSPVITEARSVMATN